MSIPPITAIHAAVNAAKASSAFAAGMAEGVSEKMGAFADVLKGDETTAPGTPPAADTTGESTPGSQFISGVIAKLNEELDISFEGPIELQTDNHGQVNVVSEDGFADRDFESRMKLQSYINGNDSIRTQVIEALLQSSGSLQSSGTLDSA